MRIFHNVTEADRRLWKAPLVSQLFPFLWAEPHHADVSLSCEDRSWQNDFSNSRSRITAWVARFLLKGRGVQFPWLAISQTYLSALFSCQRAVAKACCFHIKAGGRAGKRGILNHAPLKTAYSSGSKSISSISKPKIILISASLIRPFNSISTTI